MMATDLDYSVYAIPAMTLEEWHQLAPDKQYRAMAALRGPDLAVTYESHALKLRTTAVIRARLREVFPFLHSGYVAVNRGAVCVTLRPQDYDICPHFYTHIQDACKDLSIEIEMKS